MFARQEIGARCAHELAPRFAPLRFVVELLDRRVELRASARGRFSFAAEGSELAGRYEARRFSADRRLDRRRSARRVGRGRAMAALAGERRLRALAT
jgi:hypothetical protein